jgi:hypothetical protein
MTRPWLTGVRPRLSSERAPHRDRTTNSRPKILKRKQYLVKRPQSGLDTKTYWLTDWLSAVNLLWLWLCQWPLVREVAPQRQDNKFQTKTLRKETVSGQTSTKWARHHDILTDWLSAVKWLWLWLNVLFSILTLYEEDAQNGTYLVTAPHFEEGNPFYSSDTWTQSQEGDRLSLLQKRGLKSLTC